MADHKAQFNMGMSTGIGQHTEQRQELHMTTELVQAIRILQMSRIELRDFIEAQLIENPVLEANDLGTFGDFAEGPAEQSELGGPSMLEELSTADIREQVEASTELIKAKIDAAVEDVYDDHDRWERSRDLAGNDSGISDFEKFVQTEETLTEHLMSQLHILDLTDQGRQICEALIEEIDAEGYLPGDIDSRSMGVTRQAFEAALRVIQSMDPVGVGARSLAECLELQLADRGLMNRQMKTLLERMLADVAANRIQKIAAAFKITPEGAQQLVDLIRSLDPYPGRNFAGNGPQNFIVPDVVIEEREGEYTIVTNENDIPQIRVSSYYSELRETMGEDKELARYLNDRFSAAERLIGSIDQRRSTIIRVAESIIEHQKDAIEHGQSALRPLTQQQVADEIGVHVSTVSRAVDGKYMQCPRGMVAMRAFFCNGTEGMTGSDQEDISANGIKAMIRDMIDEEDPRKPISDQKIADRLESQNISISRRTVAKYRESMGIQPTSRRKRFQ